MKPLTLLLMIAFCTSFLTSCEENVQAGGDLTDAERQYLRERAATKCLSETASEYKELYNDMVTNMLTYARNYAWKIEQKRTQNSSTQIVFTHTLAVWKVDPPHIYYRMRREGGSSTTNTVYYKMSTTDNIDMVLNIQKLECDKTYVVSGNVTQQIVTINDPRQSEEADKYFDVSTEYRINESYPAFFSNYNKKITRTNLDANFKVTSTVIDEWTITPITNPAAQVEPYTNSTYVNRMYCIVPFTANTPYNTYAFPFTETCTSDDTAGPAGFTLPGDLTF